MREWLKTVLIILSIISTILVIALMAHELGLWSVLGFCLSSVAWTIANILWMQYNSRKEKELDKTRRVLNAEQNKALARTEERRGRLDNEIALCEYKKREMERKIDFYKKKAANKNHQDSNNKAGELTG